MDIGEQKYLTTQQNETADVLRRARNMIADPMVWCQGSAYEDGRRCAIAAMSAAYGYGDDYAAIGTQAYYALLKASGAESAVVFNDDSSHGTVLAAFDRAIALAESEPANA